ncbi:MAG: hypothetical protein C4617_03910 [Candidatus Liberibacter europaeus]|uniref:Uncharacterized protein n=1 Tax=Candidatus Liberibacter europaeus TaxID=744859 RepID=A0A2T4VX58_9HYPH|nr:hypothetical protein [Candidatus Liberibacter europaeus]PTL86357.1 MAG: hypothetical protein C4617_03910 [Candidatus Liberibacter europaeus]
MRKLALGLYALLMLTGYPAFAYKIGYCHGYGINGCCKNVHVKGYCKHVTAYVSKTTIDALQEDIKIRYVSMNLPHYFICMGV